ncbi:MAG TPA: hypothetical protein VEG34_04695 [Thermoanaerobaculia bacterium]|nr:hypothetical protein [Thermoanaerobaculia bacterium]
MSTTARFARRFRYLVLLQASLAAGAFYDLGFAALMVLAPGWPARVLDLPLPGPRFYLWILAVLLAMLAGLYLLAARDPRRYSGVIAVAIAGRTLGALALAAAALSAPGLDGLYALAAADLALGLAHALFWFPVRS